MTMVNRTAPQSGVAEQVMIRLRKRRAAGLGGRSLWALAADLKVDAERLRGVLTGLEERGLVAQSTALPSSYRERPPAMWRAV
ncbi:hypothetical protein [Streptomyces sp. GESEQ-35]|uniref:hypothetical protein n=1 Tax=Streptomyces sp. GESEQ-35 TaxID=2812657 RepID=UPI001B33FF81|nr:hypothetical protein [Streptomyces sp. GESEQ-35]